MGAQYDEEKISGELTAEQIPGRFEEIKEGRAWECGHGGYTGTFAEARGVEVHARRFSSEAEAYAYVFGSWGEDECFDGCAEKWGPAIAVRVEPDKGDPFWFVGAVCSS